MDRSLSLEKLFTSFWIYSTRTDVIFNEKHQNVMIDIFSDVPPFARKSVIFKCTSWIMEQFPQPNPFY